MGQHHNGTHGVFFDALLDLCVLAPFPAVLRCVLGCGIGVDGAALFAHDFVCEPLLALGGGFGPERGVCGRFGGGCAGKLAWHLFDVKSWGRCESVDEHQGGGDVQPRTPEDEGGASIHSWRWRVWGLAASSAS